MGEWGLLILGLLSKAGWWPQADAALPPPLHPSMRRPILPPAAALGRAIAEVGQPEFSLQRPALSAVATTSTATTAPSALPRLQRSPQISLPQRPYTGSQQYAQRLAALQAGRTYTRLPATSFHESWINATQQPTYEQWVSLLQSEARSMAQGQGQNRLSVLVGDSISQWYPCEWLPGDRFWLNQGISGDTSAGVLRRLDAFAATRPDVIHVMVGINDLRRGASDAEVLGNLQQITERLRQSHPQAQILVYSILPTRLPALPTQRIRGLNQALGAIATAQGAGFVDLQPYVIDAAGGLRRELTTDGLHLSRQGYAVWEWALRSLS